MFDISSEVSAMDWMVSGVEGVNNVRETYEINLEIINKKSSEIL